MKKLSILVSILVFFSLSISSINAMTGIVIDPEVIDTKPELTWALNANRDIIRHNISTFTWTHMELRKDVRKSLSWTTAKSDLKTLSDTFSWAIRAQRNLLKSSSFTWKLAIWSEIERLRNDYFTARISEVDWSKWYTDSWALSLFTDRKNVFLANKDLREKNIEILKSYNWDKMITKFSSQIDKFANNDKKLLKLKDWIDKLIAKFQLYSSNQATLDRLNAIKSLIDTQINSNSDVQ